MNEPAKGDRAIDRLIEWAEKQAAVRALIQTSSRANPDAPVDLFSDYDVIVVVTDIRPYDADDSWLEDLGRVLVVYRDPLRLDHGFERFARITQYEDGLKIDYTFWPVGLLNHVIADAELPDELDVGYRILVDKDNLASRLKPPTHRAHIPEPPTEIAYRTLIEEFFHEATYVAKHLWRNDLLPAKYNLDQAMKQDDLRQMLEWRIECDLGWDWKPGAYGKGLKQRLPAETWAELESTYVGAGLKENWQALFRTIDLFRKVAIEAGERLGYSYPHELDRRVSAYLQKVRTLDQQGGLMGK
jgi:aminoglycoside 6-adenylyltransferase